MLNAITASTETLLDQAPMTARRYFIEAIKAIDDEFGKGYAKSNPELVAAFIQASASDFNNAILTQAVQAIAKELSESSFIASR